MVSEREGCWVRQIYLLLGLRGETSESKISVTVSLDTIVQVLLLPYLTVFTM